MTFSNKLLITGLVIAIAVPAFHPPIPAHGFDGSDSEIPRIEQISLVNSNSPKPNEPIAILLKTSDDKNWVKIDGPLTIGFSYRFFPGRNTPPNCVNVTTSFSKLEAIEIASQRITTPNARKNQTFWLVGYLPAKKELVSNCTEYRDLNQAPVVVVNSTSFKSVTPKGSSTPVITGGIYSPKLTDESGRSAPSAIVQSLQESRFLPGIYNYAPTISCLQYAESVTFREKNQNALNQFEAEAKVARDLENAEAIDISNQALDLLKQVDSWIDFVGSPSYDKLKVVPSCAVANSTSALIRTINESRVKIKASNSLVQSANLVKRCQFYQEKYSELAEKVLAARERYKTSKMKDSFLRFSYLNLKVDCASSSATELLLSSREEAFKLSDEAFTSLEQEALLVLVCKPFEASLKTFEKNYAKASKKFSDSRYQKHFEPQNFEETYTGCSTIPLDEEVIDVMTTEYEASLTLFSLKLGEAEKLLKANKLTFNLTCSKGSSRKLVTNKTGKCPKGFNRIYLPSSS